MTTSESRRSDGVSRGKAVGVAPLDGIIIAATVAMCGSAIGRVLLQGAFDVLAKRDTSIQLVSWILGGFSVRFFVAHAIAAEAFIIAHPRLPTVRRQLEGGKGTLLVGAALGTLMWLALRAMLPIQGSAPISVMLPSWLTMALFSGPLLVWITRPYLATDNLSGTTRDARREMGRGLAVILPAIFALVWAFGTEAGRNMMIGVVFVGGAALAAIVVGSRLLLAGLGKARGRP